MQARAFPLPLCAACGAYDGCARAGAPRSEYPECREPLRHASLPRTTELLRALATADEAAEMELSRATAVVLRRFAEDTARFSEILELSASLGRRSDLLRYSYAFPSFRAEPREVRAAVLAFARALGPAVASRFEVLLGLGNDPVVEQLLVGLARRSGAPRAKLYFQMKGGSGARARAVAEAALGRPVPAARDGAELHLLGIDVDREGSVAEAKLYDALPPSPLHTARARLGDAEIFEDLERAGVARLGGLLRVTRGPSLEEEIDFGLAESGLVWEDVRELPSVARLLAAAPAFSEIASRFSLGVRRLSASLGPLTKLNVYYVLREREGAS